MTVKSVVKSLVPPFGMRAWRSASEWVGARKYAKLSSAEVFSMIYSRGGWGGQGTHAFFSGPGSHAEPVIAPYIAAVRAFGDGFSPRLNVVDLGCGDFNVGSQVRSAFAEYRARDVVPALIEHNRRAFADLDVEFDCIDIAVDPLPPGDVVLIRQVLQHISNSQVAAVVAKLPQYRYAIITEHLPGEPGFKPNFDKATSDVTRIGRGSGVVLTAPPFGLKPVSERVLCEVPDVVHPWTIIRTTLYEIGPASA